jgi:hypothetical protein
MRSDRTCADICGDMFSNITDIVSDLVNNPWQNAVEPIENIIQTGLDAYQALGHKIESWIGDELPLSARQVVSTIVRTFPLALGLACLPGSGLVVGTVASCVAFVAALAFEANEELAIHIFAVPLATLSMASVRYLAMSFFNPYYLIPAALCLAPVLGGAYFLANS